MSKPTFDEWQQEVDVAVQKQIGLSVFDLPDVDFMSAYEDEVNPEEFAGEIVQENMEEMGFDW